jgi:hypothetical protein
LAPTKEEGKIWIDSLRLEVLDAEVVRLLNLMVRRKPDGEKMAKFNAILPTPKRGEALEHRLHRLEPEGG